MKVRITFDIDDTDRIAISVASGTGFRNATRDEMTDFIESAVADKMTVLRGRFQIAIAGLAEEVTSS